VALRTVHGKRVLASVGLAITAVCAHAAADDRVIREMLKHTHGISADDIRRDYDACDSGATFSMKLCASYRWTEQEIRLDAIYERLRHQMGPADVAFLDDARRAWVAYREAQCVFEGTAGAGGGTAEGLYVLSCRQALTRQQADRLDAFVQN